MNTTEIQTESKQTNYTNDILIVSLTAIYAILFYDQDYGLNYLLFSIFAAGSLIWRNPQLLKSKQFIAILIGTIYTGALTFYFGTWYHVLMNKISLLLMAALAITPCSSLIVALFHSLFTYVTLPVYMILDLLKMKGNPIARYGSLVKYLMLAIVPIIIMIIFLSIYAFANPILAEFLSQFKFEFFSISSIVFIGYSFIIIYGLLNQKKVDNFSDYDLKKSNDLTIEKDILYKSVFNFLSLKSEIFVAGLVFVLLNIIIGLNNGLDIYHLFFKKIMPINVSFSQYIHQGVNALIASIFLAIFLMMYFFSARLNFIKNAKYIKSLAFLWIIQNGVLIYLCLYKNFQYIINQGLTYKRIGVYFFLVLVAIGLVLTGLKIAKNKTNIFLVRINTLTLYLVLIAFGSYDWDAKITKNNLTTINKSKIDYDYLLTLDHTAIPLLYNHFFFNKKDYKNTKSCVDSLKMGNQYIYLESPKDRLVVKIEEFKQLNDSLDFQSNCITKNIALTQLNN
jgi:hypothetical protein